MVDPGRIRQEYRQVFQADQCQLRNFDAQNFSQRMRKRKLIMVGDSLMRLHFYSLACLMKAEVGPHSLTPAGPQACSLSRRVQPIIPRALFLMTGRPEG